MGNIQLIYNKNLIQTPFSRNIRREYFAFPVHPIKVLFMYDKKPELNHFERAILSVLLSKHYYTLEQFSEMLKLDIDLIDLILNDLKERGLITEKQEVTENGENILKGIYSEPTYKVEYLFYDLNRNCLLEESGNTNYLEIQTCRDKSYYNNEESKNYKNKITIDTDCCTQEISYSILNVSKDYHISNDAIEKFINKKNFKKDDTKVLVNAKVLEVIKKTHYMLTYIETSLDNYEGSRWYVVNPLSCKNDYDLQNYLYSLNDNKILFKMIENLTNSRKEILNDDNSKKLLDIIENKLFNNKIKKQHKYFVNSLLYVFNSLNIKATFGQNGRLIYNEQIQQAMVNLGDMFENILYQYAIEHDYKNYMQGIEQDFDSNKCTLAMIANDIGFDINNDATKLFNVSRHNVSRSMKSSDSADISSCIAINLAMAYGNSKHFFYNLVKIYPDFLITMYNFKREYRDKARHEENFIDVSPKEYVELLLKLLDLCFGYKYKKDELDQMFSDKKSIYDYSYINEQLRFKLGNEFLENNKESVSKIRNLLIHMYKKNIEKQASYLGSLRLIIENLLKDLLIKCSKNVRLKENFEIKNYFKDSLEMENYVVNLGYESKLDSNSIDNIANGLRFDGFTNKYIYGGFQTNFQNANLRIKIQALILLMKIDKETFNLISKLNYNKLFALLSTISYYDKQHKQNDEYKNTVANILVEEIINLVNKINSNNILDWR